LELAHHFKGRILNLSERAQAYLEF